MQHEHAELEHPEDHPRRVGARERVDERSLELVLDPLRCVAVVVEELLLAGVEHQPADHEVDARPASPSRRCRRRASLSPRSRRVCRASRLPCGFPSEVRWTCFRRRAPSASRNVFLLRAGGADAEHLRDRPRLERAARRVVQTQRRPPSPRPSPIPDSQRSASEPVEQRHRRVHRRDGRRRRTARSATATPFPGGMPCPVAPGRRGDTGDTQRSSGVRRSQSERM